MDAKEAAWLAGLIRDASWQIDEGAGLTIEIVGDPTHWVQVVPVGGGSEGLDHYLVNFSYRGNEGNPIQRLGQLGLMLPPDTQAPSWEDDGFATVTIRQDVPLVALAYLINDIFLKMMNVPPERELSVQMEYGF